MKIGQPQFVSRKLLQNINSSWRTTDFQILLWLTKLKNQKTIWFIDPSYQVTAIFPVHLEPIEGVTPSISDQLSDECVLNPLQKVLQARRLWLIMVLLEELFCHLILWLCLGTAVSNQHSLDLCLSTVHCLGLTASLKYQQRKALLFKAAHQSHSNCSHD